MIPFNIGQVTIIVVEFMVVLIMPLLILAEVS
ncbi:hypothetical protein LCGC14_2249650 [marine sediment metagenome]|uniref:Uncharacterized protein n=1 Tax=marine sediment metagenome TaxID=412755 RepID=A0A0F9D2Q2_9ZZZZ